MSGRIRIASSYLRRVLGGFISSATYDSGPPPEPLNPPPTDFRTLHDLMEHVALTAEERGEVEYLKLGLQHVLSLDDAGVRLYGANQEVHWETDHLRRALTYLYERLYRGIPLPTGGPANVEIVNTDGKGWDQIKAEQAHLFEPHG